MKLIAVCTGVVAPMLYRTAAGEVKTIASGINKSVVSDQENPVSIEIKKLGLTGDEQCNLTVHGGLDKAVYMMPAKHYAFWRDQRKERKLDANLPWGFLGENLVVDGVDESNVNIGDEILIGSTRLQVTDPREPCFKFAIKLGYGQAPKQMIQAGNCGWYLKVIETGHIKAGQKIELKKVGKGATVLAHFKKLTAKGQLDLI